MSISSFFGSPVLLAPKPASASSKAVNIEFRSTQFCTGGNGFFIECSSRPKKKATKHHMKTRPKKTAPWDIRRKPTVYAPLPPLPPDWTFVSSSDDGDDATAAEASTPVLQAPVTSG